MLLILKTASSSGCFLVLLFLQFPLFICRLNTGYYIHDLTYKESLRKDFLYSMNKLYFLILFTSTNIT